MNKWHICFVFVLLIVTSCVSKYPVMNHGTLTRNDNQFHYYNDSLNLELTLVPSSYTKSSLKKSISFTRKEIDMLSNLSINSDSVSFLFKTLNRGTVKGIHYPKLGKVIAYSPTKMDSSLYKIREIQSHNIFFREGFYQDNLYYEYIIPYSNSYYALLFINHARIYKDEFIKTPDIYDHVINETINKINKKEEWCKQTNKSIFSIADSAFNNGNNYLAAEYLKRNMNCLFKNSVQKWGESKQALATYYSFSGQYEKAENEFRLKVVKPKKPKKLDRKDLQNIGKENQFVLFNEAHHVPRHRYLVGTLLKDYYDLGFRYLGLEALFKDSLDQRGYLNYSDGVYTREPVMGNLIREAKRMGYKVFNYEGINGGQQREKDQVRGIKENVLDVNPKGKAIILAGYAHINEDCNKQHKWMACLLQDDLGVNPYTINQTELMPDPFERKKRSGVLYDEVNDRAHLNDLLIKNTLIIENNCFSLRKHSKIQFLIPEEIKIVNGETIVLIYYKDEFEKGGSTAIPTYTKVLDEGRKLKFELCEGNYIFQIKDINGSILYNKAINL